MLFCTRESASYRKPYAEVNGKQLYINIYLRG